MKAEAAARNNPDLPGVEYTGAPMHRTAKSLEVPSDSLTRVGNFLGGSQEAITRLAEQRTQYLRRIAAGMDRLTSGRAGSSTSLAHMNAVFIPSH
jgi:hypothetical protein